MAETAEPKAVPTMEFTDDKNHKTEALSSPSSSDSDAPPQEEEEVGGSKVFAKKQPLHRVLGAGKPADVLLWRNKKASIGVLGGATAIWVFFEVLEYHLLPLLCYALMAVVALLFLWSNTHILIYKSPPHLPELRIKEKPFLQVTSAARIEINRAIATLRDITSGRDVKKFLIVVSGLWVLSVLGSWCNFLTLFYIVLVLLHTVPVVYEKYEGKIDALAEKIVVETKKKYAVINEKVMSSTIHKKGPLIKKNKKEE